MKEKNKLIIDFMGIKPKMESPDTYTYVDFPFISIKENNPEKVMEGIIDYVKYHKSWDWLMPVIRKIIRDNQFKTVDECSKEEWFYITSVARMYIGVDLHLAHNYVIEYIRFINRNL
jgi:hypothetical protein